MGAALGAALGAIVWVAAQTLSQDALMVWGWRAIFWSSIVVTIVAALVRSKMNESPVFDDLKEAVDVVDRPPLAEVWHDGRGTVLRVLGSFFGAWMAGLIFDATGSYNIAWGFAIALGLFAGLVHLPIADAPLKRLQAA